MTGTHPLTRVGLGIGRILLPWIAVLIVSVTLAYATTSAATGLWALSNGPAASAPSEPAGRELGATDDPAPDKAARQSCGSDPSYFGAYGWLLYGSARGAPCDRAATEVSNSSPER
jgi:hypothetical protein